VYVYVSVFVYVCVCVFVFVHACVRSGFSVQSDVSQCACMVCDMLVYGSGCSLNSLTPCLLRWLL